MKKKILITLAAGKTGFTTSSILLKNGYPVRAYVRSKEAKALELEQKGAELAIGNFDNYEALRKAVEGIDSVYYCYPYKAGLNKDAALFIKAAKDAKVKTVVLMGQRIAEYNDTGSRLTNDIREAYKLFEASGLNVIYFAPGYFANNVFVISEFVLQLGIMPNVFKDGKNPWISIGDMARCIVALLMNPEAYYGKKLFPTGPKSLSAKEIAKIFSKVKGSKVWMFNIPELLFLKAGIMSGKEYGFDKFAIVQGAFYNQQMQLNRFDIEPTSVVKELTGREPEDFETITREYFNQSKYNQRNFSRWLSAFLNFNRLPFTKVPGKKELAVLNR
ncbi:MAG: NmrA family NAD(P)-binding protein [Ferruginibacter sp.]